MGDGGTFQSLVNGNNTINGTTHYYYHYLSQVENEWLELESRSRRVFWFPSREEETYKFCHEIGFVGWKVIFITRDKLRQVETNEDEYRGSRQRGGGGGRMRCNNEIAKRVIYWHTPRRHNVSGYVCKTNYRHFKHF